MIDKVKKKALQAIADKGGKATKRLVKGKVPVNAKPDPMIEKLSASVAAMEKDNKRRDALEASLRKENDNLVVKVNTLSNNVAAILMRGRITKVDVVRGKKIAGTNFSPIDSVNYSYEDLH